MKSIRVIQSVSIVTNAGVKVYEVGGEVNGEAIIGIKAMGQEWVDHIHSEYHIIGESDVIALVENCPVFVEWQTVAIDDEGGDNE